MEVRSRVGIAVGVLIALVAAVWLALLSRAAPEVTTVVDVSSAAAPEAEPERLRAEAAVQREAASPVADLPTPPAATRSEVPSVAAKLATLRGRCVDEHGAPLADCKVALRGTAGNEQRMSEWLRDHDQQPDWENPAPIATGTDGLFTFTFWPPPPFQFHVELAHEQRGTMSGRWDKLAEGAEVDVGDIALSPGVRVAGRVVDELGTPRPREFVTLSSRQAMRRPDGLVGPNWGAQTSTRADGSFKMYRCFVPGEYEVHVGSVELVSPKRVTLVAERANETLEVVVRVPTAVETISGRVLDESGRPAADVGIEDRSANGSSRATSKRDGTFQLQRSQRAPEQATLRLVSEGYDVDPEPRQVTWGSKDVELRVRTAAALTLRVTDPRGAPVETYLARLIPHNRGRTSSRDSRPRAQGRHEDGTVVIPGLTRGDWFLLVEFPVASGLAMLAEGFTQDAGPKRLDRRAIAQQQRVVRVVGPTGAGAGTQVQLCDPWGLPFDDARPVMAMEQWLWNSRTRNALVLCEGTTDGAGRLTLRGPAGRDLGLAVLGPGHPPIRQSAVRLDGDDELLVRVTTGASLVGKVVPPEALAELHRLAGGNPGQGFPPDRRPKIRLTSETDAFPRHPHLAPANDTLAIGDDGAFRLAGLPPGAWQVQVECQVTRDDRASGQVFPADHVILVDGQTTTLALELGFVIPGTLQGTAHRNGQPFANGNFSLRSERFATRVTTDPQGKFATTVIPGEYRAVIFQLGEGVPMRLAAATPIHVARGETTTASIEFASSTLRVTVLDSKGKPAARVCVAVIGNGPHREFVTDERGVAEGEVATETVTLSTLPKALSTPEAQQGVLAEAKAQGAEDPFAAHRVALRTISLVAGQTASLEVRLPESAGY